MKKYFSLTILLFLCLPFAAYSLEVPKLQGYINDYAEMISPAAKSKLEETLRAFEQSDSTQIVILTVPSLEGENIEDFGIKVGETWKIGQKGKDNGAILIVSKQERKIRIEVGYGLEGRLTDLTAGRIIDLVIKPKFKQEDFDGGFIAGVSSLIDATRGEFRVERRPQRSISPFLSIFLFLAIFTLIMGSISRALGGVIGAIGLPILVRLFASVGGITVFILLAVFGFGAGFLLPSLFSSRGSGGASRKDGDRHHRGGGFFYGPGTGGFFSGGGGFGGGGGGGFSGGGGSFGGGGASGDW